MSRTKAYTHHFRTIFALKMRSLWLKVGAAIVRIVGGRVPVQRICE